LNAVVAVASYLDSLNEGASSPAYSPEKEILKGALRCPSPRGQLGENGPGWPSNYVVHYSPS
jgi:hypothetical protein